MVEKDTEREKERKETIEVQLMSLYKAFDKQPIIVSIQVTERGIELRACNSKRLWEEEAEPPDNTAQGTITEVKESMYAQDYIN